MSTKPRPHWTKTKAGRAKLAARAARRKLLAREKEHDSSTQAPEGTAHLYYVFGKVETFIEHYADSAGISRTTLALGVAELIRAKARRA